MESDYGRGSNEILSCLRHFLEERIVPLIEDGKIECIRFFCDSCSGQNKNYSVLLGLKDFCRRYKIDFEWYFPVRGHSYMPADRSFGQVSKKVRKNQMILYPKEYDAIIQTVGTLFIVGEHLQISDYKNVSDRILQVGISCRYLPT